MGGLHATVTPFVEIMQPTTVDELLRCPVAINGMSAPSIERDVMAHDIGPAGGACDEAEREMPRINAYRGRHSPERSGSQHASGRHGAAQRGGDSGDYQQATISRRGRGGSHGNGTNVAQLAVGGVMGTGIVLRILNVVKGATS